MKTVISIILLLTQGLAFSQQSNTYKISADNRVSNLDLKCTFSYFNEYDFDFNKYGETVPIQFEILFKINDTGTGNFYTYIEKKQTFIIDNCKIDGENFVFNIRNYQENKFQAVLRVKNGKVDCFVFKSLDTNQGYILSN